MMFQTKHTAGSSVALVELGHSLGFSAKIRPLFRGLSQTLIAKNSCKT